MLIDDLCKFARLELPGIMDEIIVQAIAQTANDFCTQTSVWDEIQDPIPLFDGNPQYDLSGPTDAFILTLKNVWAADRELEAKTMNEISALIPNWQSAQSSQPQYFNAARDYESIIVFPTPMSANRAKLTFRAIYAPKRTATSLPDFLVDNFFDALMAGAKFRLMAMGNVGWANPQLAVANKQFYDNAVVQARIDQIHDRVPGSIRVRPVRFG